MAFGRGQSGTLGAMHARVTGATRQEDLDSADAAARI
jgi:hypothetical protein